MANISILYGDDNKKGGIRAYSHMLGKVLVQHSHKVSYISFSSLNSPIYKSPTSGWRELFLTYQLGTFSDYKAITSDLIISNGYYGAFCQHTDITIYHFVYPSYTKHLKLNPIKGITGGFLEKKAGKHTIRIAVSSFLAEEVWKYYRYRTIIIPNGVDTKLFYPLDLSQKVHLYKKWNLQYDKPIILFIGRWNRRKGADVVQYVAQHLSNSQVVAVLGYDRGTTKVLSSNIRFLYSLTHKEINELYNLATIILYPSRYEPFGYVTAEGWAAGTPVITTPMGLGYELKKHRLFSNFIISDMNNIAEETLHLVKKYLNLPSQEQESIAYEGRLFIVKHYNMDQWARKITKVISYALKKSQ